MPTKVSVQDSKVGFGELRPTFPSFEAWNSDPLATALRAASDRLCLWDYRQHVPALTFFQVWQSRLQLQNIYMNRDPYLLPVRGAAVLYIRRLWSQERNDTPQLRLSARLRLHPTANALYNTSADTTNEDALENDKYVIKSRRGWLPSLFRNRLRDRNRERESGPSYHVRSSSRQAEPFALPGRLYLKLGTTVRLPGLMLWTDRADRDRRRLYTNLVQRQPATWWGFEWDFIRRLDKFRTKSRHTRRKDNVARTSPSYFFLHASWIPTYEEDALRLVAGVQYKFNIAKKKYTDRKRSIRPFTDAKQNRFLQLTMRFGIDLLRGELYITPVADGTYF